jgi:hypothetical protein
MTTKAIIATILLAVATSPCRGDITTALIGTWTGSATSTTGGTKIKSHGITTYKRFQKKGLTATTRMVSQGYLFKGVMTYRDSGNADGVLKQDGVAVGFYKGTWSATANTITLTVKASGLFPSFRQTTKTTLVTKVKTSSVSRASNGLKVVASARKQ